MRTKTRRVLAQLTLLPMIPAGMFSVVWIGNRLLPSGQFDTWYEKVLAILAGMLIGADVVSVML